MKQYQKNCMSPDVVDKATRSRMMAGIRSENTAPELQIRKGLHGLGFRYRLHPPEIPGKPDIVLPKYRAAIFVNGCFWHGHDCHLFKWPKTRQKFWKEKITGNQRRDMKVRHQLGIAGWRYCTVWECAVKGKGKRDGESLVRRIANWLVSKKKTIEIRGKSNAND